MYKIFLNLLSKYKNRTKNKIVLGRWNYENVNLKCHYANHDNCGDIICGSPKQLKTCIDSNNNFK